MQTLSYNGFDVLKIHLNAQEIVFDLERPSNRHGQHQKLTVVLPSYV